MTDTINEPVDLTAEELEEKRQREAERARAALLGTRWRISRPCYDKPHRCPGWAGGGWKYPKVDRCAGGSIRTRVPLPAELQDPTDSRWFNRYWYTAAPEGRWHWGHCSECNVRVIPWALRYLDPRWHRIHWWRLRSWLRFRRGV